jgi:predicted SAM-dependent methyltransferase
MLREVAMRSMALRGARKDAVAIYRKHLSGQKSAINAYLERAAVPALKIGSGQPHNPAWLETDVSPSEGLVYLDATARFPMPDAAFAYVYAEHMIEHVPLPDARVMLRECRRVLKPGGVIRIATPDLAFLCSLYEAPSPLGREYIAWMGEYFLGAGVPKTAAYVINTAMHAFGHQFIYDEAALTTELQAAGFGDVRRAPYGESQHAMLSNVERHHEMIHCRGEQSLRMVQAETMILEATAGA